MSASTAPLNKKATDFEKKLSSINNLVTSHEFNTKVTSDGKKPDLVG